MTPSYVKISHYTTNKNSLKVYEFAFYQLIKEVNELRRQILLASVVLLFVAMLATPVMAIGPIKAERSNNENLYFSGFSVQLRTPGGVSNEWIQEAADNENSHVQMKKAADFYIGNCYTPTSASEIIYNKWNLLSEDVLEEFLISLGFTPGMAPGQAGFIAHIIMAGGVYYKEVYVGP